MDSHNGVFDVFVVLVFPRLVRRLKGTFKVCRSIATGTSYTSQMEKCAQVSCYALSLHMQMARSEHSWRIDLQHEGEFLASEVST